MGIRNVNRATVASEPMTRVQERQEKGDYQDHQKREDERQKEREQEIEVSDEKVRQAIDAFKTDEAMLEQGISAELTGNGLGLKVALKDRKGRVLREMSGQEFLRLRQVAQTEKRGKILDQVG